MVELPIAPFSRIAKQNGADRVSQEAATFLAGQAEVYVGQLVKKAVVLAGHAGRKTIKVEDLELALKEA
jgi:histone H3/H4